MPPKPKFTSAEIVSAALEIVRERGVEALTARELGKKLGTSARPIFTAFKSMDELKDEVRKSAAEFFENYAGDFASYDPAFKKMGMMMVSFGINEPMLYRFLFMQEKSEKGDFREVFSDIGLLAEQNLEILQKDYEMTVEQAKIMLEHLWIYSFGVGALCAMKVCTFTEEETAAMLGRSFMGMLALIKSNRVDILDTNLFGIVPAEKNSNS